MPPIKRKAAKKVEVEPEEVEQETAVEETEDIVTEPEAVESVTEETEDAVEVEEETETEDAVEAETTLPVIDDLQAGPDEGFDYFETVHADLKAAGYVTNKPQTTELINYFNNMAFYSAFENGVHKIPGLCAIKTNVKPAAERTATFDMANGVKKGEVYMTKAKYTLSADFFPSATKKLADIATRAGWEPENFVPEAEAEA